MVVTFEAIGPGIERAFEAPTMAATTGRLPQGAYTTLRTHDRTRVVRLREHVHRLTNSIAGPGESASLDEAAVRSAIAQALRATAHAETRLRLTFAPPRLFVSAESFAP